MSTIFCDGRATDKQRSVKELGRRQQVEMHPFVSFQGICCQMVLGLVLIFSASGENWSLMWRQGIRLLLSLGVMLGVAQIPPEIVRRLSPSIFVGGLLILVLVLVARQ